MTREKVVEVGRSYLGYKEGPNNDTIFGTWAGSPNQPWCASYVCKVFREAGIGPDLVPLFVSCTKGWNKFKEMGITKDRNYIPQAGDIIFIDWNPSKGDGVDHVGLVEYVEGNTVHTIEGNHDNKVARWTYPIGSTNIWGYACPKYEDRQSTIENEAENEQEQQITYSLIQRGSKGNLVRIAQEKITQKGYALPKYGVDGDFGVETENTVKELQRDAGIEVDGIIGPITWQVLNSNFMKPTIYSTGTYIVDTEVLTVREGPSENYNWKKSNELTANAQAQNTRLGYPGTNGLRKDVECNVLEINGNWGRTYSGWICLDYCKKA